MNEHADIAAAIGMLSPERYKERLATLTTLLSDLEKKLEGWQGKNHAGARIHLQLARESLDKCWEIDQQGRELLSGIVLAHVLAAMAYLKKIDLPPLGFFEPPVTSVPPLERAPEDQ